MLARNIEGKSFRVLIGYLLALVLYSALGFYALSIFGSGIVSAAEGSTTVDALDALYFSIVTVSSLGYGDFRPVGLGRLLASLEVIAGLVVIALTVAKLASDRTATYVKLLYSSDNERRLKEFSSDIEGRIDSLSHAWVNHDHDRKAADVKRIGLIMVNMSSYYVYQSKVGALGEEWAKKNTAKIAKLAALAAEGLCRVGKTEATNHAERKQIDRSLKHLRGAVAAIAKDHANDDVRNAQDRIDLLVRAYERVKRGKDRFIDSPTEVTPQIVAKVQAHMPPPPWDDGAVVLVSERLRISKKFTRKLFFAIAGAGSKEWVR